MDKYSLRNYLPEEKVKSKKNCALLSNIHIQIKPHETFQLPKNLYQASLNLIVNMIERLKKGPHKTFKNKITHSENVNFHTKFYCWFASLRIQGWTQTTSLENIPTEIINKRLPCLAFLSSQIFPRQPWVHLNDLTAEDISLLLILLLAVIKYTDRYIPHFM